jgi:hypothetical protein
MKKQALDEHQESQRCLKYWQAHKINLHCLMMHKDNTKDFS